MSNGNKNHFCKAGVTNNAAKFQLYPPYSFRGDDFFFLIYFSENQPFNCHDNQSNLGVCTKMMYLREIAINANFHFFPF